MLPHCVDGVISPGHAPHANTQDPVGQLAGYPMIWRPWTLNGGEIHHKTVRFLLPSTTVARSRRQASKDMEGFHHPVRLFLPKSKTQQYLSHLGKKVLASFPVQATLHFYNDDSSSDEEEEKENNEEMEVEYQLPVKRTRFQPVTLTPDHYWVVVMVIQHAAFPLKKKRLFWKQACEKKAIMLACLRKQKLLNQSAHLSPGLTCPLRPALSVLSLCPSASCRQVKGQAVVCR
ncbi:protein ripply3 [Hoplias malabaricus]|uniref:protein ripply3 n=1 Tax=Hoplias malabaricus TaxID=27720 RepID=UPI003461F8A1